MSRLQNIKLPWMRREELGEVYCGDSYLVAVCVRTSSDDPPTLYWWELSVVTVEEDGIRIDGESWGWSWEDIEWAVPVKDIKRSLPTAGTDGPLPEPTP